jgi:hypothetical protein
MNSCIKKLGQAKLSQQIFKPSNPERAWSLYPFTPPSNAPLAM